MAVVRTYLCSDCGTRFDHLHFDRSEPAPECPGCAALEARQIPSSPPIIGAASKAGDIAYDIMSKDYGFTDMKDNLRTGDVAAPALPAHLEKASYSFFSQGGAVIAAAKAGAQQARAEGSNPLTIVQKAAKQIGTSRVICKPVARA